MRPFTPALAAALWLFATQAETSELGAAPRIAWRHDGLAALLRDAESDGKPLIVVTEGDNGRFFADVLSCPRFNTLAEAAHFVLVKLPVDDASEAGRLVGALHMDPVFASSVVALRTTARPFVEMLRLRGYRDEAALLARLAEAGLTPGRNLPIDAAALDEPPRDCAK